MHWVHLLHIWLILINLFVQLKLIYSKMDINETMLSTGQNFTKIMTINLLKTDIINGCKHCQKLKHNNHKWF